MNKLLLFTSFLVVGFQLAVPAAELRPVWKAREPNAGYLTALDHRGNTFLISDGSLVKRNSKGRREWATALPESVFILALAPDREGNVYLTGGRYREGAQELVTLCYDSRGRQQWQRVYSGAEHMSEVGAGIGVDEQGVIYMVGRAFVTTNGMAENYHLLLGYSADGSLRWERLERSVTGGALNHSALAVNPLGGVAAITADSMVACSAGGALLWSWRSDANPIVDPPNTFRIAVDNVLYRVGGYDRSNNLYVAGVSRQNGRNHPAVQKHGPDGVALYHATYKGPVEVSGSAWDLRVDAAGNAYLGMDSPVSCHIESDEDGSYYVCETRPAVAKFDRHGDLQWVTRFAETRGLFTELAGIDIDAQGRCIVSARTYSEAGSPPNDTILGLCDAQGYQTWGGVFHYDSPGRYLWALPPAFDHKGGIRAPAELVDHSNGSIDVLLTRFHPFRFRGAPKIQVAPAGRRAVVGATVELSVAATGKGRLRYQWRFNSQNLVGENESTLRLENFQANQAGDYSVEVRNYIGTVVTPEARLEQLILRL